MHTQRYQVIIVGGGPVGVALAVELGQRGITCAVVERHREVGRVPKGQNLAPRSVEHFYFWNCVDELRAARLLPAGYPVGGIRIFGDLTSDYWHQVTYHEDTPELFFQRNERLPQYLTEKVLRARAAQLPGVTLLFDRTATGLEQDGSGVRVRVRQERGPRGDEELRADYVVGCDGARSLVRRQLGISRRGSDLDQKMVLAVFSSPELHEKLARFEERSTYQVISSERGGVWQFFGRIRLGVSWFYHGPVARETTRSDHGYIRTNMEQAAGFAFPVAFQHVGFWELRADVADTFRCGRAFIAGDAAHTHPPYGAYGLNTGLEDAANLGWKLAAVLNGWAGDALLDSYSDERQPVCAQTAEDMIMAGILRDRRWLEHHDPRRDGPGFADAWRRHSADKRQDYDPHYAGSPVILAPAGGSTGVHAQPSPAARPGHHLAPQPLSRGHDVFAELGPGFTLLAFGGTQETVAAFAGAARSLGVPLAVVRDGGGAARDAYGCDLVLVRPDQYVAWAGEAAPPDAGHILAAVTGGRP